MSCFGIGFVPRVVAVIMAAVATVEAQKSGEWGTGNGERGTGNGEWGMGNGEWIANAEKLLSLSGDSETRRQGEDSEKSPNLQNSQSLSNESNINSSRTSRTSREIISATAQSILDARALYPDSSLANLYDPLTMPIELRVEFHLEHLSWEKRRLT